MAQRNLLGSRDARSNMRFAACFLGALLFPNFAFAGMTCNTRSVPSASDYAFCVSPNYGPPISLIDWIAPTDDEYARYQWNLRDILEGEDYLTVLGDAPRDVRVAVIDAYPGSQVHPDLVGVYEMGINTVEGGTNTDAPWDGLAPTGSNAHGQCVASVIAAEHNFTGVAGVFHRARIIPVRADFNTLDQAIDQAVLAGAEVIHIAGWDVDYSFQDYAMNPDVGLPTVHPLRWMMKDTATATYEKDRLNAIRDAVHRAVWDNNVIVSTVVSNWEGRSATSFLGGIHDTVTTMASNVLGEPSPFNSMNYNPIILAPGGDWRVAGYSLTGGIGPEVFGPHYGSNPDDIMCAVGPDRYSWGSGGSFAGPHVAAAAAIIKSYLPSATAMDVRRFLDRSGQPIMLNLHPLQGIGKRLSLKRLRAELP